MSAPLISVLNRTVEKDMTSVTLDQAKQILATEPEGTERFALANTIVSLYAANDILMAVAQEDEE